ncbi:protein phosphatase 1 regulatory subunit 42 [Diachasma alloeum]|uniref:protein phosphatase 1 regulatory subunit 42 n=1 Tax=Diachasma alloeum TaxID=454923 RepID=UPI0007382815|nr:protein phosphatase 1 regulatory subunit 42 [Diachasma alloeum]
MVLLTTAFIEKECARTQSTKSLTKGVCKNHLRKITHLFMNDKLIEAIGNFAGCKNLRVIYMQNNCIAKIENLDFANNLTHLYLQHNNITKVENLQGLRNLKSLYLGHNGINIVQGLEGLDSLLELHVENQKLAVGESLVFDPRSLKTLSNHLKVLNVASNKLNSLRPLSHFLNLEYLDARDNKMEDMRDLSETVATLPWLNRLFLQGNPVTQNYRYRENLIAHSNSLGYSDGKIVTDVTRRFLSKFKEAMQLKHEKCGPKLSLSDDITTSLNLPPAFKRSVSRAILQQQPGPKLSISTSTVCGETESQLFPPWKCIPAIHGKRNNHLTPRPLWKATSRTREQPRRTSKIIDSTGLPPVPPVRRK